MPKRLCLFLVVITLAAGKVTAQYCTPTSDPASGANINKVVLQDISNEYFWASGDPGYFDYTASYRCQTNLKRSQTYNILITSGSNFKDMHYAAWIDYNNDYIFSRSENLGEIINPASSTFTLTFTVPAGTPILSTRLRIRSFNSTSSLKVGDPCIDYKYGETEDYAVTLTDFVRISTGIIDGGAGDITLFNYDSDSDYDLFVQDEYSSLDPVMFFNYNAGTYSLFDYINGTIPEPENDNLSSNFCDLNNDNALDLLLTYRYGAEQPRTLYYQKQLGLLNQVTTGMKNLMRASTATADLDNDGRQDVIMCGEEAGGALSTNIYRNTPAGFVPVNTNLKAVRGHIITADFDNDRDIDILLTGDDKYGNTNAILYRNDNNWTFTNTMADLKKCGWLQTSGTGDFNADGLTDLFIADKVYRNDGNNSFSEVFVMCPDYYGGRSWNDLDNDGFQELVGQDNFGVVILKFDGTRFVVNQHLYTNNIDGDGYNTGDYNDDNKVDIFFNLYNDIYFFKNQTSAANAAPTAPYSTSLRSSVGSAGYYTVSLTWAGGTDDHTVPSGLTYNLRVGTTTTGNEIMSSMTSPADNSLLIPGPGNVGSNNGWILRSLAPGTYYWSVQSVDNSGVASPFSVVKSFVIETPLTATSFDVDGTLFAAGGAVDIDSDNDMDLILQDSLLVIHEQLAPFSYKYHKVARKTSLIEIRDLNNDNKPDLVTRHNHIPGTEPKDSFEIFINKGGYTFERWKIDTLGFSSSASADFDNDGDIDILSYSKDFYIFKNIGLLKYARIKLPLSQLKFNQYTALSAMDIDSDNDIDFIISGREDKSPYGCYTFVFKNTGNLNFVLSQTLSPGLGPTGFFPVASVKITISPDIVWNDHNLDGYPDLMISGDDFYNNTNNILYINDRTGNFIVTDISPRPTDKFSTSWTDFNKDGKPDLIMPKVGLSTDNSIYLNVDSSTYQPFETILDANANAAYIDLADVDKDLDKDIIVTYKNNIGPLTYKFKTTIYKNTFNFTNAPPAAPGGNMATIDSFTVHLAWKRGTDYLMGSKGFTYNIWVGTSPSTPDIISPMSDLSSGFRFVEELGNVGTNTSWTLKNLPLGTYYWGVQTIDNSLQGSAWSTTGTFEITAITADFSNDIVCTGTDTHFTDNSVSTQAITSWEWDFGGGNKSTLQNPAFKFATAGIKSVRLVVSAGALRDTLIKNVTVKPKPKVSFSAPAACGGQLTSFTNTTVFNGTTVSTWLWTFGDGNSSTDQNPAAHGFLNPGIYTATLMAVATNECSDTYSASVSVGSYPVAVITAAGSVSFCDGKTVTLSANGNPSYLYNWRLDGTLQTGATADSIVAKTGGSYTVEITNPTGNCLSVSNPVNVTVKQTPVKPVLHADNYVAGQCPGESPVRLSTQPVDGYNYMWQKDGVPLVRQTSPNISFYEPGLFRLIAEINGCTEISDVFNADFPSGPEKPVIYAEGSTAWYLACSIMNPEYHYKWYYNGSLIPDADDKYYYMANRNLGIYMVSVGDENGCYTKSDSISIPLIYTAIDDSEKPEDLIIYPNPGKGIFNLAIENSQTGTLSIRVINPEGRVLLNMKYEKSEYYFSTIIDLTRWSGGNYFVFIDLNGRTVTRKIIKE